MADLFSSGRIVDFILGIVALEIIVLALLRARTRYGPPLGDIIPNLLSGACLLMALRCALTGTSWLWPALWLAAAFAAHLADLARRILTRA